MKLKVVSTGSVGNAYIIENDNEALLLECGVNFSDIKKSLKFNLRKVAGMLITHSHGDHCKGVREAVNAGIDVYCLKETSDSFGFKSHRLKNIVPVKQFSVGNFKVMPFELQHDVPCLGFIIEHKETGRFIFLTDTYYCSYNFPGLNNIIVEANYCENILNERLSSGAEPEFLRNRVIQSHMSIQTCKDFLRANDLKAVNNIVLIHLSDRNSHAKRFQDEVRQQTGKKVHIAEKGLCIDFNSTPF